MEPSNGASQGFVPAPIGDIDGDASTAASITSARVVEDQRDVECSQDQALLDSSAVAELRVAGSGRSLSCQPCTGRGRRACLTTAAEGVLVAVGSCAWDYVFENPICGAIFRCGCTWEWDGGWANCNVHKPSGPRCPWCIAKGGGAVAVNAAFVVALMVLGWALAATWAHRKSRRASREGGLQTPRFLWVRFLVPPVVFVLHAVIASYIFVATTGYPYWLWWTFEDTQVPSPALPPFIDQ